MVAGIYTGYDLSAMAAKAAIEAGLSKTATRQLGVWVGGAVGAAASLLGAPWEGFKGDLTPEHEGYEKGF
jgi:hypothetical protein